jgi:hypothetical protein
LPLTWAAPTPPPTSHGSRFDAIQTNRPGRVPPLWRRRRWTGLILIHGLSPRYSVYPLHRA